MYSRKNGRVTFRSNRRQSFKKHSSFGHSKIRNKGNISQQYQKYLKLAKEASSSGDRIQAEYYYQFADHFFRTMVELGIALEENENLQEKISKPEAEILDENPRLEEPSNKVSLDQVNKSKEEGAEEDDPGSIESVPFISEPAKKKTTKSKKEIA